MTTVLRACAIAIVVAALIDPSVHITRELPLPVRVHADAHDSRALAVREQLRRSLEGQAVLADYRTAAVVAIGERLRDDVSLLSGPVSTVSLDGDRDVAIVDIPASVAVPVGSAVDIPVELRGRGMPGAASVVTLEERGIEIARVDHRWTQDGFVSVVVPYLAATAGIHRVTVLVREAAGARLVQDGVDINIHATARPARVAVIEARPSWQAGFVRRALEDDPRFRVSSLVRFSKGVTARAGDVSRELRRGQLDPFDVVLIGAPEDLQSGELETLGAFADVRGGTVVFLPDTSVRGTYQSLLPAMPSEELLREPQRLVPAGVLASEILALPADAAADDMLARHGGKAVIVSGTLGDGQFMFSGALDAWRYRADPRSTFTRFWREIVSSAALRARPRIDASVDPAVVGPLGRARITVRLRRTEFADPQRRREGATTLPALAAAIVDPAGQSRMIRLWPTAEAGVFTGDVNPSVLGVHDIRVTADNGAAVDTVVIVDRDAAAARGPWLEGLPELTGGVAVGGANLQALTQHLSSLRRPVRESVVHPMRSAWWMAPFACCLCLEWLVRRRRGER